MKITFNLTAFLAALVVALPVYSQGMTQEESAKIDAFLASSLKNVKIVKTAATAVGEIISCVDVNQQPAMNHPLASGAIQLEPSERLKSLMGGRVTPAPASKVCPLGSVEMRLPTREQIVARGSLKNFLSKYPNGKGQVPTPRDRAAAPNISGHYYAVVNAYVNAMAAQTTINPWRPALPSNSDFSLSQMWVVGGADAGTQTVEAGSQIYPDKYGNADAHVFIYYTGDNYGVNGCYNLDCSAFIQTSSVIPIGGSIPESTFDGFQFEGTIAWYRDPSTGNWILFLRNADGSYTQAGYYPVYLFGQGTMSLYASRIDFGGEVYTTNSPPTVPMGSGYNPNYTFPLYSRVAYQRNLAYMDTAGVIYDY